MREIKFKAWNKQYKKIWEVIQINFVTREILLQDEEWYEYDELMQYTGLKDKNGVEIYELMEIDNKYRVIYQIPKYVLQDISTGDIIDIYEQGKITGEYSPIS